MIITRTPYRISFFGGGTDYQEWYREFGGAVLATTINKYCYITTRYLPPFFEHRFRIVYSKIEQCENIDDIVHPAVREVLRYLDWNRGIEIHHDGDLPARSGMGSSSSFTVGLLNAVYALRGYLPSKHQLARESIYIEHDRLKEAVGSQDQVMAAYGGLNLVTFETSGAVNVGTIPILRDRLNTLNDHLMLFYTGIKRTASTVAETYNIKQKEKQLHAMKEMVQEGLSIINSTGDLNQFGRLLNEAWQIKCSLSSKVSNSHVQDLYDTAIRAGALGGKLLGAGGGGFMLLFAHPSNHQKIREKLSGLLCVPFKFEHGGSQVIFCDRDAEDYADLDSQRKNIVLKPFQELLSMPKETDPARSGDALKSV